MGYLVARLEALKAELAALPEADRKNQEVNKQEESVRFLAEEIGALQQRGYTMEEMIPRVLPEKDVEITRATLKSYMREVSSKGPRRGRGCGKRGTRQEPREPRPVPSSGREEVKGRARRRYLRRWIAART